MINIALVLLFHCRRAIASYFRITAGSLLGKGALRLLSLFTSPGSLLLGSQRFLVLGFTWRRYLQ